MSYKRHFLLVVLIAATLIGVAGWGLRPREILFRGKTINSWLNDQNIGDNEIAMQIWQGFGSNAVPFLRKALDTPTDGPAKKAYWALRRHLPGWINDLTFDPPPSAIIRFRAADGLGFIGDAATPAVPDLIRLSKSDTNGFFSPGFVRGRAIAALGNIGQNLKPSDPLYQAVTKALIDALKDADPDVRSIAASGLKLQYPETASKLGLK
jgi:HEAT repeat protein